MICAVMTIYRTNMTIIQYHSCWHNLTVTGKQSMGVDLGYDAPTPGLYDGGEVMLLILTLHLMHKLSNIVLIIFK